MEQNLTARPQQTDPTGSAPQIMIVPGEGEDVPEPLKALLATASPAPALQLHGSLDQALAATADDMPVLIPIRSPVAALAARMQAGSAPGAALEDWRARTAPLIAQCRKARRHVLMIDIDSLEASPEGMASALTGHLSLGLTAPKATRVAERCPAVLELLAQTLIEQAPDCRNLAAEIDAMAVSAGGANPIHPDRLEQVFHDHLAALAYSQAEYDLLQEERDLLRDSLAQMQEELATQIRAREARNDLQAEMILHKAAHEAAEHQLALLHDSSQQREAVLSAEILGAQDRETALQQELDAVYASRSWRVTGPLRRASIGVRGGTGEG